MSKNTSKSQNQGSPGQNFNELKERFSSNIYGTPKGRLRLDLIQEDLDAVVMPGLSQQPTSVLDVGCGEARFSLPLAGAGHRVTLTDISSDMLAAARSRAEQLEINPDLLTLIEGPLQEVLPRLPQTWDLVLAHAVLEWVDEPAAALDAILNCVRPGGQLSLAFYNHHALIYRNLLQGNFKKLKKGDWDQRKGGLTPQNPIEPEMVYESLSAAGFEIQTRRGIRTFYDFMPRHVREGRSYEDVLEMERTYSTREPFLSIARYIHLVARRS